MPEDAGQGLERFVRAQARQYADAIGELRAGRKRTHWIWFVLPQLRALGCSGSARVDGLEELAEAAACWRHPMLGTRLRDGSADQNQICHSPTTTWPQISRLTPNSVSTRLTFHSARARVRQACSPVVA